ncbi:MAG: IS1634 family transposase [Anaerolineales bacterium]|nr:IS1634 family transposase [Anaerolineales bacterium]
MDTTAIEYDTKRLDHLGIVAGICHEIGLVKTIDALLPTPSERKVSCGQATLAMILNGLGFTGRALYLMPEYMENKPVDLLISEELVASNFNDDTLGRALDELFQAGITELFAQVAQDAVATYQLDIAFAHTDTSSFSLSGQYESEVAKEAEVVRGAVKITHGYSKDHRPDLKQVVVTLITSQKGGIPLWLEALDGNSSDKNSFGESVDAYCRHLADGKTPWFVLDSAAYTADNIANWGTEKRWLMRVPETITEAQVALQSVPTQEMPRLANGYAIHTLTSQYGGVSQRWLVVYSEQAEQRELKQLNKRVTRATTKAEKAVKTLNNQEFGCEKDARQAVEKVGKKLKWHQVTATYHPIMKYLRPGRPPKGAKRQVVGWQVKATCRVNTDRLEEAQKWLGRCLLATNEVDKTRLPDEKLLAGYKAQGTTVERGFRFLKDPLFFADSLFLKSPARIMAMIMIMGLCLLIYALAKWRIRQQLQEKNETIPDQRGQPTQTPTMRRIAQMFEGVDLFIIRQGSQVVERQVLKLTPVRLQLIHLFGPTVQNWVVVNK